MANELERTGDALYTKWPEIKITSKRVLKLDFNMLCARIKASELFQLIF